MERVQLALTLLSIELRNAKSRQRERIKRQDIQSLAVENLLSELSQGLRTSRKLWKKLAKFEGIEWDSRKLDKPAKRKTPGVNRRLTGTYGKTR